MNFGKLVPMPAGVGGLLRAAAPLQASEGGAVGPFEGNVGNAVWTLVVFALVVVVLGKFAWGPILSGLTEREKFIRQSLEEARHDRKQAEARLQQYTDQLNAARNEATAIVEEAGRDAWGDYWIIDLKDDYSRSIVGEPSGRYLWILSRTPEISPESRDDALSTLRSFGYDTSKLYFTQQPPAE